MIFKMKRNLISTLILPAGVISILSLTQPLAEKPLFTFPSAFLSALYFCSPLIDLGAGTFLVTDINLYIIPECSGYSFYMVLLSLLLFQLTIKKNKSRMKISFILLAVYPIVITVNFLRIVCSFYAGHVFPYKIYPVVHQWVGILIFLPVLIMTSILFERIINHE